MYQANYWKDNFHTRIGDEDFIDGVSAALITFGWLRTGVLYIGQPPNEFPVYQIINGLRNQLQSKETNNDGAKV